MLKKGILLLSLIINKETLVYTSFNKGVVMLLYVLAGVVFSYVVLGYSNESVLFGGLVGLMITFVFSSTKNKEEI